MKEIYANMILAAVTVVWGGGFIVIDGALDALSPFYIMMMRFVGAVVFPLLVCWKKPRRLDRATIGYETVTGIFLFLAFTSQTFGLKYSAPSKNASLTAINVALVPCLLWLLWHRCPPREELTASLLYIVDIALLTLKKDALMLGFGDMLSPIRALFFASHIIALERYPAHVDAVRMIALQMMTAGVISTVCALTLEQPPTSLNWHAAGNVTYLISVSTLPVYLLQTFVQKFTTANSTSPILSMEAPFASIFSFLLLEEIMSPPMILGACLIFSSTLYIEYKPGREKKEKQQDICRKKV